MKNLPGRYSYPRHNRRGSALIICVWALIFFSILSVGIYQIVSAQIALVKAIEGRAIGQYLAKAAFLAARVELKINQDKYDTLSALRQKREKELGQGKYSYSFIDEESKININTVSADVLKRLPGLNEELVQNITTATLPKPLKFTEELLLVDGIDKETFDKFKDYITTNSSGLININTAPAEVLNAVGLDGNAIAGFRLGPDGFCETMKDAIERFGAGSSAGILTIKSSNYSVKVESEVMGRKALTYIISTDEIGHIRKWDEY